MNKKQTPWLKLEGTSLGNFFWTNPKLDDSYAEKDCLKLYFDIPDEAKSIRFVKGKHKEALYLNPRGALDVFVLKHPDDERHDHNDVMMCDAFLDWLGEKPHWVWVEWK